MAKISKVVTRKKKSIKGLLPFRVYGVSPEDFKLLQKEYREIMPNIRVIEVGYDVDMECYIGMLYQGRVSDKINRKYRKDLETEIYLGKFGD